MACHNDYDGVFFTIQAIRMNSDCSNIEFIVLDNDPSSKSGITTKKFIEHGVHGKYIPYTENTSTFVKYEIIKHVQTPYYLGIDCHVLLRQGAITELLSYFKYNPDCKNIIQGPLVYDDLNITSTHFDPVWRDNMFGTWGSDARLNDGVPFEIPMNGMGLFACETKNFPKISDKFRGFGGEEWYIQEKFRQNGGKCVCLPQLGWVHRFDRPNGIPYPNILEDRFWNYYFGWMDLYKNKDHPMVKSVVEHFKGKIPDISMEALIKAV